MTNLLKYLIPAAAAILLQVGCTEEPNYPLGEVYPEEETPSDVEPPHQVRARKDKKSAWGDYLAYTVDRVSGYTPGTDPETDKYGGWKVTSTGNPSGFFRTQQIGGRWWMLTPEGNLYICKGVAVFNPGNSDRQVTMMQEKFGTTSEWARQESSMLKDRGFNGLGAWSNVDVVRKLSEPMPYTVIISPMGKLNGWLKSSGEEDFSDAGWEGYPNDFAMVFHPKLDQYIESEISTIAKYKDDPYCIGYFSDNEIPWKDYALDRCLTKWPKTHLNNIEAQKWLDTRKGKVGATLSEATTADRKAFIAYCLDIYLKKVTDAIRKYDPNHLYLGCRFNQWNYELVNDEIFRTAGKYMDIVSINHYQRWQPDLEAVRNWGAWAGKPFFVTEFYTKGEDSELPNNTGAGWNVRTQAERGYFYQNFAMELLKSKVCVGWHWFTYQDNDPENMNTDPSNRDSNKGMVTWDFKYYTPLLDNMETLNENVYQLIRFYDKQ